MQTVEWGSQYEFLQSIPLFSHVQFANVLYKLKEKEEIVYATYSLELNQFRSYVGLWQHSVYHVDNV